MIGHLPLAPAIVLAVGDSPGFSDDGHSEKHIAERMPLLEDHAPTCKADRDCSAIPLEPARCCT